MSKPASYACPIASCGGTAHRETFLLPTGEPDTMKLRELWECDTCGTLWNLDGIPWKPVYYWNLDGTAWKHAGTEWKPADFVVRES